MMLRTFVFLTLSLPILVGCSQTNATLNSGMPLSEIKDVGEIKSIELYLSRTSHAKTEFEQLKLSADNLFAECGQIRAGRYYSESQGLETLKSESVSAIRSEAKELLAYLSETTRQFDGPGNNGTLFDPGQFFITLQTTDNEIELKTNLDSISEPTSRGEKILNRLAQDLRGAAGSSLCSNRTFFGLGAS